MKFLMGIAVGWSIARWMNGQPLVPSSVKQLVTRIVPEQLPAGQQQQTYDQYGQPILQYRN